MLIYSIILKMQDKTSTNHEIKVVMSFIYFGVILTHNPKVLCFYTTIHYFDDTKLNHRTVVYMVGHSDLHFDKSHFVPYLFISQKHQHKLSSWYTCDLRVCSCCAEWCESRSIQQCPFVLCLSVQCCSG